MNSSSNNDTSLTPIALGRVRIFPLLDAVGNLPLGFFFQADKQKPMLEKLGLWNQLLEGSGANPEVTKIPFRGFLVVTPSGEKILFDLGIGASQLDLAQSNMFLRELQKTGTSVEDILYVVLSHLHADHTGWAVRGDGSLTFPNAEYLVMQNEVDHWASSEVGRMRVLYDERVAPLLKSPQLKLLPNERCLLTEKDSVKLEVVPLPGHTPGHLVLRVQDAISNDDPKIAYFIGDALHFDSHRMPKLFHQRRCGPGVGS